MRKGWVPVMAAALAAAAMLPLWRATEAAPALQNEPSACRSTDSAGVSLQDRQIVSSTIRLCETAQVSVTVGAECDAVPLHIVVNVDRSGSMVGQPIQDVKNAGRALVRALDMENHPNVKVGLVSHGDPAQVNSYLTSREGQILGQIGNLNAGGEDNLSDSINKSYQVLTRERRGMTERPVEVMVVLSDGGQTYPPEMGVRAAGAPKGDGVLVVAICAENGTAGGCQAMKRIASSAQYYFEARGTSGLNRIFTEIAEDLSTVGLRSMVIEEQLPDRLELVPGSVVPEAEVITDGQKVKLRWSLGFPRRQESVSYRVQPLDVTTYTLATSAVTFRDSQDRIGSLIVPTRVLTVSGPCLMTPTPTPTFTPTQPPVPTSTPTPTRTPTATPTFTPTPTPTPKPGRIFLPILGLFHCWDRERPTDVVLLVDASTSMEGETVAGRPKLEAARDGARAFVDQMRPVDHAAVFSFNDSVQRLALLTGDRAALRSAIDRIEVAAWTRLDLALLAATEELDSRRAQPEHLPVVILLTDGHPTHTTPGAVQAAAESARQSGAVIFAIGVGNDLDADLLRSVAGDPSRYFAVEDAEALPAIYRRISETIPCEPGR